MSVLTVCDVCHAPVYTGIKINYRYPPDIQEIEEGVLGEYLEGCGRCEDCSRELCEICGQFVGKVCKECRKEDL